MTTGIWNLEFTAMKRHVGGVEAQRFQQSGDMLFTIESLDILLADETVMSIRLERDDADVGYKTGRLGVVDNDGADVPPPTAQEQAAAMMGYPFP